MSRSLIISLLASVVVCSAQADWKEQVVNFGKSAGALIASYPKISALATVGMAGFGVNKLISARYRSNQETPKSQTSKVSDDFCQRVAEGAKKSTRTLQQPGRLSRMLSYCPTLKTVGKTAVVALAVGAAYYFRGGIANRLRTIASKAWAVLPAKAATTVGEKAEPALTAVVETAQSVIQEATNVAAETIQPAVQAVESVAQTIVEEVSNNS